MRILILLAAVSLFIRISCMQKAEKEELNRVLEQAYRSTPGASWALAKLVARYVERKQRENKHNSFYVVWPDSVFFSTILEYCPDDQEARDAVSVLIARGGCPTAVEVAHALGCCCYGIRNFALLKSLGIGLEQWNYGISPLLHLCNISCDDDFRDHPLVLAGIRMLLDDDNGIVNQEDVLHNTGLMSAAYHGAFKTFQLLIEYGADITAINKNGFNALHMAVASCYPHNPIIEHLVAAGLALDDPLIDVATPLLSATRVLVEESNHVCVSNLEKAVQLGASVLATDMHGNSTYSLVQTHLRDRSDLSPELQRFIACVQDAADKEVLEEEEDPFYEAVVDA